MAVAAPDLGAILAAGATLPGMEADIAPDHLPLALLPVRLETRFFTLPDGASELRVRVYPDKIHIDSHDPALSADERLWGQRFWELTWAAGEDETRRREAWAMLAGRVGPQRAGWVARALTSTNPDDRPTAPVAGSPPVPPAFPELAPPEAGGRPARLRLLPRRWTATAYAGGAPVALVSGRDIPADLAVSPDLQAPVPDGDDVPAVDDGMRWMIDFDRAEEVGMGLRMPLPAAPSPPAVDLLLVTGTADGDRSAELAQQLDAHRYADGLAFLAPGTPTNNTEAGRTPFQAPDPGHAASFAAEWGNAEPTAGSAADLAARSFGVDAFDKVPGGGDTDERAARAMATVLWPSTWGYFLAQMVGFDDELTFTARAWVRQHALNHLRPGGPLPALLCGRQPYGLLPVMPLDAWTPRAGEDGAGRLRDLLAGFRDRVWRPAALKAPRVGLGDDAAADLADVLQFPPLAASFAARNLMGRHFLQHLRAFLGEDLDAAGFWTRLEQLAGAEAARLGFAVPMLRQAAYDGLARAVTVPLVGDPAYIADLHAADDVDALAQPVPAEAVPLLQALLRHGLLREHVEAAALLLGSAAEPAGTLMRDVELVDLLPGQAPAPTWSRLRDRQVGGITVRERLAAGDAPGLAEFRAALGALSATEPSVLERHLVGTLDATSHRLDAWITSLAARRLAELREANPDGLTIGGYGWVESLKPDPPAPVAPDIPDEPGPLALPAADPGFVHAPSLTQASAAALLRNAHLAHGGSAESPYAIDLSSARVRMAKRLFDGIRQGQSLGELLGYLFERALHERNLDELIDDVRRLSPPPGAVTPDGTRRLVVDGLDLAQKWQDSRGSVLGLLRIPASDPRRPRLEQALDRLTDALDAAADAVNAESAFQMLRGNFARAAAPLDAIATGAAPPPELEFIATPRTGISVTHRVAMLLGPAGAVADGWASDSPRARAAPALAAWAARLLGPVTGLVARVETVGPDGTVTETAQVPVSALGLTPLDFIHATEGADGLPPEVSARILHLAGGPSPGQRIDLSRQAGEARSLGDLIELGTRAQRLIAGARPLSGADLQPVRADPQHGSDLEEFETRVSAAEAELAAVRLDLRRALQDGDDLVAPLMQAAAFGVPGAIPQSAGVGAEATAAQARQVLAELERRLNPAQEPPPDDPDGRSAALLARMRTVFGAGFLALPRFAVANVPELAASRADAAALLRGDPLAALTWLLRMERVRPALARMTRVLREAEVLDSAEVLAPEVAQVPHRPGRPWAALDVSEEDAGATALVLQGAPADLSAPMAGLLIDEWTETVPSRSETTGIAFQFDPPDAAPPQAILLAVAPVMGAPWTISSLNRVLIETLDLARLRLVDPEDLGAVRHYLPAAYLAFNAEGDAVSTDLNPLAP
ncbi:MAG: hypothetical protein KDA73_11415 [Rhodobacteraceae bacterium]|nr:hypothetical protein [Paracoccaceae bacterium]